MMKQRTKLLDVRHFGHGGNDDDDADEDQVVVMMMILGGGCLDVHL